MTNDNRWLLEVIVVECAAAAIAVVVDGGGEGRGGHKQGRTRALGRGRGQGGREGKGGRGHGRGQWCTWRTTTASNQSGRRTTGRRGGFLWKDLKCVVSSRRRPSSVVRRLYLLSSHVSTLVHRISTTTRHTTPALCHL